MLGTLDHVEPISHRVAVRLLKGPNQNDHTELQNRSLLGSELRVLSIGALDDRLPTMVEKSPHDGSRLLPEYG